MVAELPPLPPEVAGKWVDAQFACTDFVEESTRAQEKVTKGRLDSEAYAACLREALTDEQIRDGMVDASPATGRDRAWPRSAAPRPTAPPRRRPPTAS